MRFWDLSGPEVEAADTSPWDGPFASAFRPLSTVFMARVVIAGGALYLLAGIAALAAVRAVSLDAVNREAGRAVGWLTVVIGASIWLSLLVSPAAMRRLFPPLFLVAVWSPPILISLAIAAVGPGVGDLWAVAYIEAPLFAFYVCRIPWALVCASLVLVGYGAVLVLQDGWEVPIARWTYVAATVIATAVIVGLIAERAEEQVTAQVAEIERLTGLRRFLSPQVADAVLSGEAEEVTRPHRRRIAVVFCDLRGFTAFTNNAEPEEVVGVLDQYYGAVGGLLQKYDATVGDYAGDGIMAYFGDPVPREDAALAAVEMTREIAGLMGPLVAEWQRQGHALDYGVGLAYGYATLGVVGFDGRYDYKPVGGVVNLAARLCARAGSGQVLLDHPTYAATSEHFASAHFADLDLKGYAAVTRAYALT